MSGGFDLNFAPPGPVAAGFLADLSPFTAIMGPMGSSKTSTCIMKCSKIAAVSPVSRITGERLCKIGVVRNTFADLKRTTIKSIENWFSGSGKWGGGGSSNEPPFFKIGFSLPDGTVARLWLDFIGLDAHNLEQLAKGWEIGWYWINEADLVPRDVKDILDGRIGRYPGAAHCKTSLFGGFADYNAPDTDNWLYKLMEEERPAGHVLYKQPSGLSPAAENIANLADGYYTRMMVGKEDWWIRRNILNQYGYSRDGMPVYPEYNDDFHCAASVLLPAPQLPVRVDFDQGLHPACLLRQIMPNGQLRVLDELYSDKGAKGLCESLRRLMGDPKYDSIRIIGGSCDPAAAARDGNEAESWVDYINRLMGWTGESRVRLAKTNNPDKRQAAVRYRLRTNVLDGQPGLLISKTCPVLRKGFNSDYRLKRRMGSYGQYEDAPEKIFPVADLHDALQYGALSDGGYEEVTGRDARSARAGGGRMRVAKTEIRV